MRASLALLWLLALCAVTAPAQADLGHDVDALVAAWKKSARVRRLEPQLIERGGLRPLLLTRQETDPTTETCTSVAVLGSSSTTLVMRFLPSDGPLRWPDGEWPEQSVAGAVQLVRCGIRKAMLERLALEMRSPRGVIEVVVAQAARPLPPLLKTLVHRDPGPAAPLGPAGPRPVSSPLAARTRALEQRARREGAREVAARSLAAGRDGSGDVALRLAAGCHRIDVLGIPAPEGWPRGVDLDADLVWVPDGRPAAQDRTDNADAMLAVCTGEPRLARLHFTGTVPTSPVVVLTARWDLPRGLPPDWGPGPRARMAEAIRRRHQRDLPSAPIYSSLGVTGVTLLPIEVEPGACYLVALAAIRGEPAGMAIAVVAGNHRSEDNPGPNAVGTAIAFCAGREERASIDVEARGVGLAWLLGVWQTARLPIGEVAE
jgi:hypothetical protein